TLFGSGTGRFCSRQTGLAFFLGKLHDQDCILCRQTDQQYHRDLDIETVLQPEECESGNGPQQSSTERQDNHRWQCPAFILGNKKEIGEEEGKRENDYLLTAASAFLERQARPLIAITIREGFRSNLLHRRHGLTTTGAGGWNGIHLRRDREVVAGDDERRQYRGQ